MTTKKRKYYNWTYFKYRYLSRWGAAHTWDRETDMWYFYTNTVSKAKRGTVKTIETTANVDLDSDGNVVGIELYGWDKKEQLDTDGEINIKIVRRTFMGKPTHWEIEAGMVGKYIDGGIEGTAPTLYGVTDMFFEYLADTDEQRWSAFDANARNDE